MSPSKPSNTDEETAALPGASVPSSRSTAGPTAKVIPFRRTTPAAARGFAGEDEADHCWEPIGLVAVRVVGNFDYPRLHVEMSATEGPEEEEVTPR